jgi:hypothetical protein
MPLPRRSRAVAEAPRSHVLAVRVTPTVYEAIRRLARTPAQRATWLRAAIAQALQGHAHNGRERKR